MTAAALFYSVAVALNLTAQATTAAKDDEPLQQLIDLIDDAEVDLKAAGAAYTRVPAAFRSEAAQALVLLCVRHGKFEEAAKVITGLPTAIQLTLPLMRLRLWLALESRDKALAENVLKAIGREASSPQLASVDRLATVRFLGALSGTLASSTPGMPDPTLFDAVVKAYVKSSDKKTTESIQFESARQSGVNQRARLESVVGNGRLDQAAIAGQAERLEAERKELQTAADAARIEVAKLGNTIRTQRSKDVAMKRDLDRQIAELKRDAQRPAPGKPDKPIEPRPPFVPSIPQPTQPALRSTFRDDADKADYERQKVKYENDLGRYNQAQEQYRLSKQQFDVALSVFRRDSQTFPDRLADWQKKDDQRRKDMMENVKEVQVELDKTVEQEKARQSRMDELHAENAQRAKAAHEAELQLNALKRVAAAPPDFDPKQLLDRPSSYDLLSLAEEQRRLRQTAK